MPTTELALTRNGRLLHYRMPRGRMTLCGDPVKTTPTSSTRRECRRCAAYLRHIR